MFLSNHSTTEEQFSFKFGHATHHGAATHNRVKNIYELLYEIKHESRDTYQCELHCIVELYYIRFNIVL